LGKWGHFSEDGREYIVTNPSTPRPWINYLTNGHYCAICSHTGGGYSFVDDSGYNRITREHPGDEIFEDRPGRYVYVHEVETGKIWSLNWQPALAPLTYYEARVGLGYTAISAITNKLQSDVTYFVPMDEDIEVWMVNLKNLSKKQRTLRIYTYSELVLGEFKTDIDDRSFVNLFNKTWFDKNVLFATKSRWHNPDGKIMAWDKTFFATLNVPVEGHETMRERFLGEYQYLSSPNMVKEGLMPHHIGDSADAISCLVQEVVLKPNETHEFDCILGTVKNEEQAHKIRQKFLSRNKIVMALKEVNSYWQKYNSHLNSETPDKSFDASVNVWNRYQCWVTAQWSEMDSYYIAGSGVFGFRDEAQHIYGILPHDTELYCKRLHDLLIHQFKSGMTVHNWDTFNKKGTVTNHSDDPQWLAMAILNFIKETGDLSYLSQHVPYYDGGDGEVYDHLIKALDYTLARESDRGISLRQKADWNDALSGSSEGIGESMMVANQLCWNLRELIPILHARNDQDAAAHYFAHYERISHNLNKFAWDGQWYIRATEDTKKTIGSHKNNEGVIHLNGQTWPIISGVAQYKDRGIKAMKQVWKKLMTPYGPTIFLPSYTKKNSQLGIISQFTPGTKENGTIFLHPTTWAIIAECILGRGDEAYEIWRRASFITRSRDPKYKSEPYVYPEYMYGPEHPKFGQGSYTWITGSAAWNYRACTDYILGVRPVLEGLLIDPCVPKKWSKWKVKRDFRGCSYIIEFNNPNHVCKGVKEIIANGHKLDGVVLPLFKDATVVNVQVEMK
jgi:cellobiose phosphorylase